MITSRTNIIGCLGPFVLPALLAAILSSSGCNNSDDNADETEQSGNAKPVAENEYHADQNKHRDGISSTGDTLHAGLPHEQEYSINPDADFTHFRVGPRNVKAILADGDIVWVGTSGGIIRYNTVNDSYELFDVKSGLLANGIFHLSKYKGQLLSGTYGGGMALMKDDGKGWDIYNIPNGLADAFVYDVQEMDNGDIWIATWSGANLIRGGKLDIPDKWEIFTVKNTNKGLPNDWVYALEKGTDGSIWFATEGGLAHYKDGRWSNWKHEDGLGAPYEVVHDQIAFKADPQMNSEHHTRQKQEFGLENVDVAYNPNYIVALLIDRNGIIWCGTWGGGLARFDGSSWKNYTVNDGLPGNHVFMLYEDPEGFLWIGTSKGLARKDGETFSIYTTKDGLFANNIFAMTKSDNGDYWVGSYGGVARISGFPPH